MRILNADRLSCHGNKAGRQAILQILEAGLQAADPYYNTLKLLRVEGDRLIVGHPDFEPKGSPVTGEEVFDLRQIGRIYVIGAGKGVQRVAKAIEDVLGDRLTGGHVIAKHGDGIILERIGVTLGGHPLPDEGCVEGCQRILKLCRNLREDDLVFTIACNGVSSLLTLPVPGVSLEDVRQVTYQMQIERGVPTFDLNAVRNHLDLMKGGRISTYIQPATAIHIIAVDPANWDFLMHGNRWLHTLPESTTFADAIAVLKKWQAWDVVPESVRQHLLRADPAHETVKADAFRSMRFRVFGVMPHHLSMLPMAQRKARELGFTPYVLATYLHAEASHAGTVIACIANAIEQEGTPFEPPCALFTTGELLVTVGEEGGIGGRNQEYVLAAALRIAGSENIIMGSVDTDGTDGPGGRFAEDAPEITCLGGGIVDGYTVAEAARAGVDILDALRHHDTSAALWKLDSGVVLTQNISIGDLGVTLIMGRAREKKHV
ncbi:MAG: glycerate kinase [Anaerolineae bacterium]